MAGNQTNPIDLSAQPGFKVPPPPPFPPSGTPVPPGSAGLPPHSAGSSQGGVPLTEHPGFQESFKSEDWLKKQTFFFPQPGESQPRPPSPGKQAPPTTRKGKTPQRPRKQSRGENNLKPHAATDASDAEAEDSSEPSNMHKTKSAPPAMDGDAMDIDPEPTLSNNLGSRSTSPKMTREPRLVNAQVNRPEWRENITPPGAVPNVNGSIPPGTIPSAVPNAAVPGPPMPPPPPPPATASNTKQKRDASGTLNFDSFRNAAPFSPSTNGGLSNLKNDLAGTLPFESQAAPSINNAPRQLELPLPPKAPTPPLSTRIPQHLWKEYMASMAFYMGQYFTFNDRMLAHFTTRHREAARFGTGNALVGVQEKARNMELLEALGDSGDGYASYLRGLQEDVRVQKHWDVAREKHRDAIEALVDLKKKVAMGQVKVVL